MQLVSIIVPCYNQAQYLSECLQSVIEQTYQNWECIIVNDSSPDNTEKVAKRWVEKDSRFKYIHKENGGLSSTRNYGIAHSQGEFILPLDADDKISENYIELAIEEFNKDAETILVYCKAEKFGNETGLWELPDFSLYRLALENMIFCSALYRKKVWDLVGGYDINMIYGLEDWEFWIALLKNGGKVKRLEKICFYYRIKAESMVKHINEEKRKYSYAYLSIKHSDFYVKQLGSFHELNEVIEQTKKDFLNKLNLKENIFFKFKKELISIGKRIIGYEK